MKENEILREIMRDAKIGWWQADRNRRVFHISEGLRDLLGVASCDVTYEEFGKMITPAYREYALASIGVRGGAERLYPLQGPRGGDMVLLETVARRRSPTTGECC